MEPDISGGRFMSQKAKWPAARSGSGLEGSRIPFPDAIRIPDLDLSGQRAEDHVLGAHGYWCAGMLMELQGLIGRVHARMLVDLRGSDATDRVVVYKDEGVWLRIFH